MNKNATHMTRQDEEFVVNLAKALVYLSEAEQMDELSAKQWLGLGAASLGALAVGQKIHNNQLTDKVANLQHQEYVRQNDSIDNEFAKDTYNASGSEFVNARREMLRDELANVADECNVDPDVQNELFRGSKPICTAGDNSLKEMARLMSALNRMEPGKNCVVIYLGDRFYLFKTK